MSEDKNGHKSRFTKLAHNTSIFEFLNIFSLSYNQLYDVKSKWIKLLGYRVIRSHKHIFQFLKCYELFTDCLLKTKHLPLISGMICYLLFIICCFNN